MIGVKYLIEHYYNKHDAQCLNDLLVMFMKDNRGDHFLIDEVPTTELEYYPKTFYGPDLTHLTGKFLVVVSL